LIPINPRGLRREARLNSQNHLFIFSLLLFARAARPILLSLKKFISKSKYVTEVAPFLCANLRGVGTKRRAIIMSQEVLLRRLGLKETMALVIGNVIGTGVFLKAAIMSQQLGSALWVVMAWAVAGALSLIGAFCYAELGARFPRAGGEYVYLREGYGGLAAFLFGWMRFWVGSPGSIAAYSVGAATFLASVVNLQGVVGQKIVAVGFILFFTALNCLSVSVGGRLAAILTALKITSVVGLTFVLFVFAEGASFSHLGAGSGHWAGWSAFASAMIAALWAYDGWNNMPMAAGEVRHPERTIPRALVVGMVSVLAMYVMVNLAYFYVLPFSDVISSFSKSTPQALPVATKAAGQVFGLAAAGILSIAFVISAIGAINGALLTSPRVPFAMARDGLFFKKLGEVSRRTRVPVLAVIAEGSIACVLALSGTFDQLTDYVVFASWIFYALTTATLFQGRARDKAEAAKGSAESAQGFRVPGYPWVPLVFILVSVGLLINTLITAPRESGMGLAFILAGVPVYFLFRRSQRIEAERQGVPSVSEAAALVGSKSEGAA
jgi:APA family basic amino acid/polyamine antiporter